ncbi:MAG TPA: thiamine pyrophosphate-dependent enzyme [Candidatus Limnocylindria bacterium]|nr:thiamine pyrophosphate-dependent enzyme [Candidatus Limnocylindria bacterium]
MAATHEPGRTLRTIGRLLADSLAEAGVEWAFTVPGESFLGLLDALPPAGIRVLATRHEGGAAFMAEATAQFTGRPAACLGTRAVGAANLSIGIHTARQNSTPMVALVGQVQRDFLGREAFQEADQPQSFGRLAKWAGELTDPADAARLVGDGLRAMTSGRPGPVLFSLPEDLLDEPTDAALPDVAPLAPPPPEEGDVEAILRLLTEAERPLIVAGGGVLRARAVDRLVEMAEALAVPVMAAWRRPDVFPNDHPLYLGMTGYGAASTVLPRLLETDALLVLGCRLSEPASFGYRVPGPDTRWAHVDLEPRSAERAGLQPAHVALTADAGAFLARAMASAGGRGLASAARQRQVQLRADREAYLAASTLGPRDGWSGPGVDPGQAVATLQRVLPRDAVLTTDAGNFGLWPARGFRFTRPGTFLGPTSGAMGYGLPAAIAASLCAPDRTVVAMCGDGGFTMTMSELETAVRAGARPVVLVFDNQGYGTIAMHQQREGRSDVATRLGPIDFSAVARACGAQGGRVTRDSEFEPALRDALAAGRPAVIHLEVDPRWVSPDVFAEA